MYLPGLGLSDAQLSAVPDTKSFPRALNQACRSVWDSLIPELEATEPEAAWAEAISTFVGLCASRGQYAFSNTKQSNNDRINMQLQAARRAVLKFINQSKVFKVATLKAVKRQALMVGPGFLIRTIGEVQSVDPFLLRWIQKRPWPAFNVKSNGKWAKQLAPGVTIVLYNTGAYGSQRWVIAYEIVVPIMPALPHPMASKSEFEDFVLKILWKPVLTSGRPYQYHRKML